MSAKVVSLSRARKDRARSARRAEADANAARHGRTRAEREAERDAAERAARALHGHRLGDDPA